MPKDEYLAEVDEHDRVVGLRPRADFETSDLIHRSAYLLIIDGRVDVAVVPVGNSGYTMDGIGALKVIKEIEPKVVIPTHFADKAVKYEVPQVELAEALKGLSMEPAETVDKFKPASGELSDTVRLIVLNRQ